jgi:hypothetical protein
MFLLCSLKCIIFEPKETPVVGPSLLENVFLMYLEIILVLPTPA